MTAAAAAQKQGPALFVLAPTVFDDLGCAQDYAKASAKTGVARRKALLEVVEVGCAKEQPGVYSLLMVKERKRVTPAPNTKPIEFVRCALITATEKFVDIVRKYSIDHKRDQPFVD